MPNQNKNVSNVGINAENFNFPPNDKKFPEMLVL